MAALIVAFVALGTLAFGAVYPWGYLPLGAAAALIGLVGIVRFGVPAERRPLALSLALVCAAGVLQIVPLPRATLDTLSPATMAVLNSYNLAVSAAPSAGVAVSIDPARTTRAVLMLAAFALYLVGVPSLLTARGVRTVPQMLMVLAIPLALFGIYTREYNNGEIYGFWRPLTGGGAGQAGPFVNRNHFAGWMLMTAWLLIGALFGRIEASRLRSRKRPLRTAEWLSSADVNQTLWMGAAVLVAVIALFWSMSRSAILGFMAAMCAFAWVALYRPALARRRTLVFGVLATVLLAAVAWRGPIELVSWFQDDRDLLSRFEAWRDGWDVVRSFPLFGTGLNTYSIAMLFYQTRNPGFHMAQAHNDYLQLLAEGGLLVTLPAAAAVLVLARAVRSRLREAAAERRGYWIRVGAAMGLLGIAVQEVFEFSLQIPVNAFLFATLAAIVLAPAESRHEPGDPA